MTNSTACARTRSRNASAWSSARVAKTTSACSIWRKPSADFRSRNLNLGPAGGVGDSNAVALGLVVRWASATRDGDLLGGDFPSWLLDLLDWRLANELTDTRGECIYSACDHYRKCFIEHTVRRARDADIVVANHALVLIQAALGGLGGGDGEDSALPGRYVFDEGHHLFDAADSAFSAHLSGRETADLRRWLLGAGDRGRAKGLDARARDLITGDAAAEEALDEILRAAHALPGPGWATIILGFIVLASEYAWARRLLEPVKRWARKAADAALDPRVRKRNIALVSAVAVTAAVGIAWYVVAYGLTLQPITGLVFR